MNRPLVLFGLSLILASCAEADPQVRPRFSMNNEPPRATSGDPRTQGERDLAAGRYVQAIEQFRAALRRDAFDTTALNGLGISYSGLGRHRIAREHFERALALDGRSAATLNNIGRSWMNEGQWQTAVIYLQRARARDGADPLIAKNLETASQHAREAQPVLVSERSSDAAHRLSIQRTTPALQVLRLEEERGEVQVSEAARPAPRSQRIEGVVAAGVTLVPPTAPAPARPVQEEPEASDRSAAPVPSVVVLNGTGRRGMAARFKAHIERNGDFAVLPANADRYTYRTTVIFHTSASTDEARRLAGVLPQPVDLVRREAAGRTLWLRLGSDLLVLDEQLLAGNAAPAAVRAHAFAGAPS